MWTENSKAISEVNTILKQLDKESLNKIPKKMLEEIEKNSIDKVDYIKIDIPLEDLKLEEETKEILAVICYNYFCDEEEKTEWNKELEENERKYQDNLREKYNPDNIFKNIKKEEQSNTTDGLQEQALMEYKENFFMKLWEKLKKWFKR